MYNLTVDKTYSDYWRRNYSIDEAVELVLCLKALRKVAGYIMNNEKPIYWRGMAEADKNSIILDPGKVIGSYPIAASSFDVLVGQVVFEGLLSIEWSEWLREKLKSNNSNLSVDNISYLISLISVAEELYIDKLMSSQIWSFYLSSYFKSELNINRVDPSLPPNPNRFAWVWRQIALTEANPDDLHDHYYEILDILNQCDYSLLEIVEIPKPVVRRDKRIELYSEIWDQFYIIISEWEDPKVLYNMEMSRRMISTKPVQENEEAAELIEKVEDEKKENNKSTDTENEDSTDMTDELDPDLATLLESIEQSEIDLTKDIDIIVKDTNENSMKTLFNRSLTKTDVLSDKIQVKRLKTIFQEQDAMIRRLRRRHIRRGLQEGKIDSRRLYRTPLDGRVFLDRSTPNSDYLWNISLTIDATFSMRGKDGRMRPWQLAEQTFVSLAEAAKGFNNNLEIFAYRAHKDICRITQLYYDNEVYTVSPWGQTPSGQAILATALMLDNRFKRNMIIHVTDGATNCGVSFAEAVKYCQNNSIELYTIGCGCDKRSQDFLNDCLPRESLFLLEDIYYLADALEYLFRRRMLNKLCSATQSNLIDQTEHGTDKSTEIDMAS